MEVAIITKLLSDPFVLLSSLIILLLIVLAMAAPFVAPYDPLETNIPDRLTGPSKTYFFGTDHLGRDILSRVIWGSRISLIIGFVGVFIGLLFGTIIGVVGGFFGGRIDSLVVWFTDTLLSFPMILMAILVIAFFGSGLFNIMVAIGISLTPRFIRVARATTLSEREKDYVIAARSQGATIVRILFLYIIPNILPSLMVMATIYISSAILIEASLSYLGLGIRPPNPTWGSIVNNGRTVLRDAPWVSLFPGGAIMITVIAFNLIGDSLRDFFDPRLK